MSTADANAESAASNEHDSHVAHHFDSAQQQFDAGKLGMWLFLVTEVLFFSGLFVVYAVYRANHPEVFVDAHKYLNTSLGALNTIVLLFSSLTMAWGVRCAQLGQKRQLVVMLSITLSCASFFLGVKAIEYSHKWNAGLLWAGAYSAGQHDAAHGPTDSLTALIVLSLPAALASIIAFGGFVWSRSARSTVLQAFWLNIFVAGLVFFLGLGIAHVVEHMTASDAAHGVSAAEATHETPDATAFAEAAERRKLTGVFFSIYYMMTGVHAFHILAGMGVIAWLLIRALRDHFGPSYFGPVDFVGLYWHLVDLVWIFLFPLLYLIR